MRELEDFWADEEFEDTVAAALIACFESKVKKNKGAAPSDRMTDDRLMLLRKEGPYISSNSRFIDATTTADGYWQFDIKNDDLPKRGCYAFRPTPGLLPASDRPESYLIAFYLRQVDKIGRYWHKRKSGTLYEMLIMSAESSGYIDGERRFVTVSKTGEVVACTQKIANNLGYQPGFPAKMIEHVGRISAA